jgi:hypothetical protein
MEISNDITMPAIFRNLFCILSSPLATTSPDDVS